MTTGNDEPQLLPKHLGFGAHQEVGFFFVSFVFKCYFIVVRTLHKRSGLFLNFEMSRIVDCAYHVVPQGSKVCLTRSTPVDWEARFSLPLSPGNHQFHSLNLTHLNTSLKWIHGVSTFL